MILSLLHPNGVNFISVLKPPPSHNLHSDQLRLHIFALCPQYLNLAHLTLSLFSKLLTPYSQVDFVYRQLLVMVVASSAPSSVLLGRLILLTLVLGSSVCMPGGPGGGRAPGGGGRGAGGRRGARRRQ